MDSKSTATDLTPLNCIGGLTGIRTPEGITPSGLRARAFGHLGYQSIEIGAARGNRTPHTMGWKPRDYPRSMAA